MRRITGAAALAYVVLAAIESMELLGMPPLGASDAAIETAYANTALGVVTVTAGARPARGGELAARRGRRGGPARQRGTGWRGS
jgi:hypothetical protein